MHKVVADVQAGGFAGRGRVCRVVFVQLHEQDLAGSREYLASDIAWVKRPLGGFHAVLVSIAIIMHRAYHVSHPGAAQSL